MNLEDQVCSLEHAKKLKELGVKQESFFKWRLRKDWYVTEAFTYEEENATAELADECAAFTVAELGELCPQVIWNACKNVGNEKVIAIVFNGVLIKANTEADARAKMMIYLLENNLITNP